MRPGLPSPRPLFGAPARGAKGPSRARRRAGGRVAGRLRRCGAPRGRFGFVLFWGGCVCFGRKRPPGGPQGRRGGGRGDPAGRLRRGGPQVCGRGGEAGARVRAGARPPPSELLPSVRLLTQTGNSSADWSSSLGPAQLSDHLFPRNS